ncbi:MAG: protein kinase [Chloroflexales bacterium]|nr:protein kinase [Chloroflexales bacterium]
MSTSRVRARSDSSRSAGDARHELRNYRLDERIGQEELATVYRAAHLTLDRPVHVHILRRTDWISSSRFQLAGRLAARLDHPNLLPVIDAGHDDRYGDYMVTPLLDAQRLDQVLADGPLEPLMALRIATQVAAALDYLHGQQVIHRDVQPANILVNPQRVAYLFNLSLAASPDTPDLSSIDEADYLTPYSAPEQRLDQGEASPTLDIYSLGAVIYAMLSGETPPAPGSAPPMLASRNPTFGGVDRVLQRMMAEHPDVRFATATAAITSLRQALRAHIDLATEDMEESNWDASADWLENPLETVMGDALTDEFKEYIARAHKRADDLHRRNAIRLLLNRWSRKGNFRRVALGQLIQPEQIVSYNIYFFELRTHYETRTIPQTKQRAQKDGERSSTFSAPLDVWDVDVPAATTFDMVKPQDLVLPNSIRVFKCPDCGGVSMVQCQTCRGKGTISRVSKVRNPDNTVSQETLERECPTCRGYGKQKCSRCEGNGNLVEEQVFTWSRRARLWQNSDDLEGLPSLALQQRAEAIYTAPIDPYAGRWHSVAPLSELLRAAIAEVGDQTRLIAAELSIRAAPITEIDYQLNEKPHRLFIVGHDNEVIGDWTLLNMERIALFVVGAALILVVVIAILLMMFN